MANEGTARPSVSIRRGSLNYPNPCQAFNFTVDGEAGPTPGTILVTTSGVDVNLSALTAMGGVCVITNLDDTNFVILGVWEPDITEFLPVMDLLPGESWPFRLSRYLGKELTSATGTSSTGGNNTKLRLKAVGGPCYVRVDAFDK